MRDELSQTVVFKHQPTEMNMTMASMQEAVEFWLTEKVFREDVKIESVIFCERNHFTIKIKRGQETGTVSRKMQ